MTSWGVQSHRLSQLWQLCQANSYYKIVLQLRLMRKVFTHIDKLIILCKNVQSTSAIYSQTLGLKVHLQSPSFVELKDRNNFSIYLQQSKNPSQLTKGYSPILSFNVENFEEVYDKLMRYGLIADGEVIETQAGKIATLVGAEGQIISINNLKQQQSSLVGSEGSMTERDQIKQLLQKIKL